MITIKNLIFNAFQVNAYILFDETKECIIVDAACGDSDEDNKLFNYIEQNGLKPVCLISTHTHVDHVLGNKAVIEKYNIPYRIHKSGLQFIYTMVEHGRMFGFDVKASPMPTSYIQDNEIITFGNSQIQAFYTPGHVDGSLCFYAKETDFVITGDVLFCGSVGRSDLPTGDHATLIESIKSRLMVLPNNTTVYAGHGPETTIGNERENNPFL